MDLADWMARFRELHQKAKASRLSPEERLVYDRARDELTRAFLAVTQAALPEGFATRRALRMPIKLEVELDVGGVALSGESADIGVGGMGAFVSGDLPLDKMMGEPVGLTVNLIGQPLPVRGAGRIVGIATRAGRTRLSLSFQSVSQFDLKRIEQVVWDKMLEIL